MKSKTFASLTLLIVLSISAFAQESAPKDKDEKAKELEKNAIKLLDETRNEINSLRTIENRISFTSELANLMWFHDADEGKRMFKEITDDFTAVLSRYNAEINSYGGVKDEGEFYRGRLSPTDKTRVLAKISKAIGVRRQIALSIAAHDAELGNDFVIRTSYILTDATLQNKIETQNTSLESAIIAYMAGQDIDKALAFARKQLKKGFSRSMLNLLTKVAEKDMDKANSFASEVLDKVSSELKEPESGFHNANTVLEFGLRSIEKTEGIPDKKPIFKEDSLKSLAEDLASALISRKDDAEEDYRLDEYHSTIKAFSPSSAERLQRKYKDSISGSDKAADAMKMAGDKMKEAGEKMVDGGDFDGGISPDEKRAAAEESRKQEILGKLNGKDFKELPKEEKQKIIEEAQRIISASKDPTEKIGGLSGLAATVKQLGDEKLASELMDEASLLVTRQPKNYIDYMQIWTLAVGYSQVEPNEAFPILENAIYQLNDTLEAFVKVGEFIDTAGDLVIENEVQLGSFGGAMTQGFLGQIGGSEGVIGNLAKADFAKTKGLADRFSRAELRILVKMMIMRSILDDGENTISAEDFMDNSMFR